MRMRTRTSVALAVLTTVTTVTALTALTAGAGPGHPAVAAADDALPPAGTSIPFGAHGDAVDGTSGQPVALSPTSLLVLAEGPDGTPGTADDETLLVTGIGSSVAVKAIATKHASTYSTRIERLSATRAAMSAAGDDGVFGTTDDAVLVLDRLGSENLVLTIPVGGLGDNQQFTPERLTSDRFDVPSVGADLTADTADDEIVVVTLGVVTLGTERPSVERLAAPFQRAGGRTRIIAVSPTAFFVASDGPDKKPSNGDDRVYLFRADPAAGGASGGPSFARTDLPTAGLNRRAAGRSVRLNARAALVVSAGPDFKDSTADDQVLLLDGGGGTVTPIPVPFAKSGAAAQPTVLTPGLALVATLGADGVEGTPDDAVAILSALGTENIVRSVVVGPTGDNNECRPVRLDAGTFALVTFGSDGTPGTPDDEITIVHDAVAAAREPLVQHVVVGALAGGTTSALVPIAPGALLVAGGGADQVVGTSDDAVVVLSGIGSSLAISRVPIGGALDSTDAFRFVPEVLGGGRAALLSSGADDDLGDGGDDAVRVIDGLGLGRGLEVRQLRVRYARTRPARAARPAQVVVQGRLVLDDASALTDQDLTISIGNASQTLAAGSLTAARKGRFLTYSAAAAAGGFVRSLSFNVRTGAFRVRAGGADQDLATTAPGYVPVGIDLGGTLVPESLTARATRKGFSFRKRRAAR